jgi:hypothetical protein
MTPIERATAAAEAEIGKREMVDTAPSVIRRLTAERVARAVLSAIREPSEGMVAAAEWDVRNGSAAYRVMFRSMIDAALDEENAA